MVQIGRAASFPATGAYRVSPSPWAVFPLTEPGTPGRPVHRFDDPEGGYPVRYLATALRGALIEVLDQFRTVTATEQRLRQVQGVGGLDILAEETAGRVPEKWLAQRRVGVGHVPAPGDERFLDVVDEDRLAELNLRPRVQAVLSAHPEVFGENARLDFGTIQGSGAAARKLTQAVSRELHDDPEALGIRYISRHTENEECWAVFEDRVALLFDPQVPFLDASDEDHRAAVQSAASLLKLTLPPIWS